MDSPKQPGRTPSPDRTPEFVRLLQQHDRQIATYVHSLIPSWADAEDVLQETSVRLWEQFDRYEPGTKFGAWACTVARYLVLSYQEKTGRDRLRFSSELLQSIAEEVDRSVGNHGERVKALAECIGQLSEPNKKILELCYTSNLKIKEVAKQIERTANATYLALSRVRMQLHECVNRKVAQIQ